jgi:hypothetical protein
MSFLNSNDAEYLSARITQKGRNAIAKGAFDISYFTIGDSEYNYNMTGTTGYQSVFTPLDKETHVKYPLQYTNGTTIYGVPINQTAEPTTLRNQIGPAGFISDYSGSTNSSTIKCLHNKVNISAFSGSTSITVTGMTIGTTYSNCQYITLALNNTKISGNILTGKTNSLTYKIVSVSGLTSTSEILTLDRPMIKLLGIADVICNKCELEIPVQNVKNTDQHNPWTMNVVWGKKPIGIPENTSYRNLSGYTSNKYIGVKEFLGYGSKGQTFTDFYGVSITGTSYVNSFGEIIEHTSEDQRSIAIVHFSEIGDLTNDPDRFFKYDDYIGTETNDRTYFQVYLPFLLYHRNTGSTIGAIFNIGSDVKFIVSNLNNNSQIEYRDLLDEMSNKVGKVFVNNKTIVFDDEEIVAALDYKSNRHHTLPAPKLGLTSPTGNTHMLSGTGTTMWMTYGFGGSDATTAPLRSLPCNYVSKINGNDNMSNVTFKFGNEFSNLKINSDLTNGFLANEFFALVQTGSTTGFPNNNEWKKIDLSTNLQTSTYIDPTKLTGVTFTITKEMYDGGTSFNLTEDPHMNGKVNFTDITEPHFGDEQPFPGSIKLVRATDIEEMNFLVNLPSGNFTTSQNPTYISGDPIITEVALLNNNKEVMVKAKTSKPIKRTGTQVFAVKLDF